MAKKRNDLLERIRMSHARAAALMNDFSELLDLVEGGVSTKPKPRKGLTPNQVEALVNKSRKRRGLTPTDL